MRVMVLAVALAVAGCASNPGVVSMGPETFMVSRQAATGFTGIGSLKADAITEANAHCAKRGQRASVTDTQEAAPPYVMGNYPRVEVRFVCA